MRKLNISGPGLAVGFGGGMASALLAMLVVQKTWVAFVLGAIAWLPLMIAAMGFGPFVGAVAVLAGMAVAGLFEFKTQSLVLANFAEPANIFYRCLGFALILGVPSWILGRLAVVPLPTPAAAEPQALVGRAREGERRLGLLLAVAIALVVIAVWADFAITLAQEGGFDAFIAHSVALAEPMVTKLFSGNTPLPEGVTAHEIALIVTYAQMPMKAGIGVAVLAFNVWLAARIAQASHLLPIPWPDIPRNLRLPRLMGLALAVALGLCFAHGPIGVLGLTVVGALVMGFAMQGLSVVHGLTRGKSVRLPLLILVYLTLPMLNVWGLFLHALLGLIDAGFALRDREKKKPVPVPGPWQRTTEDHKNNGKE